MARSHFDLSMGVVDCRLKRMKRADSRYSFPVLALLLVLTGAEAVSGEPRGAMASIWRVSSATATVFLTGSVHLLRESDHPLPPVYDEAYERSEKLLFEVDPGAPEDPAAAGRIANAARLPSGETIREHVGEETYELLRAYLKEQGIEGEAFDSVRPGMVAIAIAAFEHMRKGAMPHLGVDMVYYKRAQEDRKPVAGLETTEFQLTLFSSLSASTQEIMLRETLENIEGSDERSEQLIDAWRRGKVAVLRKLLADEVAKDEETGEALLFRRNREWLPEILKLLEGEEDAMVVVGAGHLVGEGSVIDLLGKRGYRAEQMRASPAGNRRRGEAPAEAAP